MKGNSVVECPSEVRIPQVVSTPHKLKESSSWAINFLQAANFSSSAGVTTFRLLLVQSIIRDQVDGVVESQLQVATCNPEKLGQFPSSLDPLFHPILPPHSSV